MIKTNPRDQQLSDWVKQQLKSPDTDRVQIELISGDASFRRYFRVTLTDHRYIAVDAPVETEDTPLFVELAQTLKQAGIETSEVIAADFNQGFMLQKDLGDIHLVNRINSANYQSCYQALFPTLSELHKISKSSLTSIKAYDRAFVLTELNIFDDWFVGHYLNYSLSAQENKMLEQTRQCLADAFLAQPQVAVHRDFHCKNIMLPQDDIYHPVLIDFQGMLIGPVCYDLVSLLKDCYLSWPGAQINQLSEVFRASYYPQIAQSQWQTWFDLTGLQRHIKCAGIFARLALRDNKPAYLAYLPNVLAYIEAAAASYPELAEFSHWFTTRIQPEFTRQQSAKKGDNG